MIRLRDNTGRTYLMNDSGQIVQERDYHESPNYYGKHSDSWRIIGFSTNRGWNVRRYPNVTLQSVLDDPKQAIGTHPFDVDHGTTRLWGANIESAYRVDLP